MTIYILTILKKFHKKQFSGHNLQLSLLQILMDHKILTINPYKLSKIDHKSNE